jgi:hypothetical protein
MHVRLFGLLTFALSSLALPHIAHAARANDGCRVRTAAGFAAALRITLSNAHITATSAVPSNDSLRALGQKPYCRVEATVDAETHIVALLPDDWNGRFLMGGGGGYAGSVENQFASTVHEEYATGRSLAPAAFVGCISGLDGVLTEPREHVPRVGIRREHGIEAGLNAPSTNQQR